MHRIVGTTRDHGRHIAVAPPHVCINLRPVGISFSMQNEHRKHAVIPAAGQIEIGPAQEDGSKHECCLRPSIMAGCNVLGMFSAKLFQL